MDSLIGQKLYLRIWLAVVAAVAVLALVVGWLWQVALDQERAQNASRAGREIVLRNSAGDIVGQAPARAVRVPGEGLEFQVTMKDGQTLYVQLPRANRPPDQGRKGGAYAKGQRDHQEFHARGNAIGGNCRRAVCCDARRDQNGR